MIIILYYLLCISQSDNVERTNYFEREPIFAFTFKNNAEQTAIQELAQDLNSVLEKYLDGHHYDNQYARFSVKERDFYFDDEFDVE